ncbi:hypothetical protein NL108_013347 [Boleophthalmus pectinirostris]|nr:hypothetical protein NL108_013347 [Boleophthalmus pectinirostris]
METSRRQNTPPEKLHSEALNSRLCVFVSPCFVILEKQAAEQARMMQDDEHEADGEEEDEEDEEEVWRRRRAPPEGRSENAAQPTDAALRKRAVRGRGDEEEDESES